MSISPGQTIGNYRVLQQIGTGGMGAVYLAEHPMIGKKVALKVIHKELGNNREVVGRFFNEARAVNRIGNDHIVEVHDFGQSPDGYYFFLMEYLEGRTLAHVLAAERCLSVQRMLHISAQIADALGAAHTAGIIHRDLKPDNVMLIPRLGDNDFVKILDFGLAKMFGDGVASNLTAAGVVLGTPQYMSPEACESKRDIDHRTDIYAVGILMYQMLCGQVPFDGESMGEVLVKQVTHAPPAPRAINPTIAPSVEQIILRCLAKAPDARFATMAALRDAIMDPDKYLASSPPVVPAALTRSAPGARTLFVDDMPAPNAAAGPAANGYGPTAAIQTAPVGRSTGPALALKPPPPSIVQNPSAEQRTMFQPGNPSGQQQAAYVPTAPTTQPPMLPMPMAPSNQTMIIGTPPGYKDRPPRKVWPIVLILVIVAAGGGVALAMILRNRGAAASSDEAVPDAAVEVTANKPVPKAASAADAGTAAAPAADAGTAAAAAPAADAGAAAVAPAPAGPDAAPAAVTPLTVTLRIESDPDGADIWLDGVEKGKTPLAIDLAPSTTEHELVLKHDGMKDKTKKLQITDSTTLRLELEKASRTKRPPRDKPKGGKEGGEGSGSGSDDDLMRPPWEKKK